MSNGLNIENICVIMISNAQDFQALQIWADTKTAPVWADVGDFPDLFESFNDNTRMKYGPLYGLNEAMIHNSEITGALFFKDSSVKTWYC